MHLSRWAAADPRFPFPHLREKWARKRGQGVRGAERRAAGACAWALLLSRSASSVRGPERVPAALVRRAGVPQVLRGARSPARVPAGSGARRDACGNFSPAPQVRVPAFRGAGPRRRRPRVPAPPPLPPPASSSFPAPRAAGPQGAPQAQPHPPGAARSHAPAAAGRECTQRASGVRALQVGGTRVGLRCGGPGPGSTRTWGAVLRPPWLRPRAGPLLGNSLPLASSGAGGAGAEGVLHFPASCLGVSLLSPNRHSSQHLWSGKQLSRSRSGLHGPWWANPSTW